VLPGPSAALAALVASALPSDAWREVWRSPETVVAFESPRRLGASLASLASADAERAVAVCRELTKLHEEIVRGRASELAERYAAEEPKGEIVVVVGGATSSADEGPAVDALRRLVDAGARARPAAAVVSELTGVPANTLYRAIKTAGEAPGST
jgi:16S rRNA (cytidine1402-2'-O)-methyltransferase